MAARIAAAICGEPFEEFARLVAPRDAAGDARVHAVPL
jgi:hypothetical protein